MTDNRTKSNIGLCMAAGGIAVGFDSILSELRAGRSRLVLLSSDASDRTKKQLGDKCETYSVPCVPSGMTSAELGGIIGKAEVSAISFNGRGCFKKVREAYLGNK